jgi:hypothetical protein
VPGGEVGDEGERDSKGVLEDVELYFDTLLHISFIVWIIVWVAESKTARSTRG